MEANERTAVIANAARLLQDATLLVEHTRFASAFALALLGVEENRESDPRYLGKHRASLEARRPA
jgi:HEAT repeat protein